MAKIQSSCYAYSGSLAGPVLKCWGPGVRNCYILHYVVQGSGSFVRNGKSYALSAGESFAIRPFEKVQYRANPNDPWKYVWLDFTGEELVQLFQKIGFARGNCIVAPLPAEKILPYFHLMQQTSITTLRHTAIGMAAAILGIYADSFPKSGFSLKENDFEMACALINSNFHRVGFNVAEICRQLGVSRSTLHRAFIAADGTSPAAYLTNFRMERAADFLKSGFSVKATAVSCGYSDPLYFSKVFKARVGCSPGTFRGRHN